MSSRHDRLHVFIPHREKCLNTLQMVNVNLPVLSPLGEVQKINRDGINQTDVQPVGKSSHCPKHWLLPIRHSLNLTKTFKSCMVTHAWPSKIQKSSSYCCYFFTYYLLANVTYYWWSICSNAVLSFAPQGVKIWSDPFKPAGKWFPLTSLRFVECVCVRVSECFTWIK